VTRARGGELWRKTRTAASLPGRVAANEDKIDALECHVATKIDEMRAELAEIRSLLRTQIDGDAEATELLGRLLQAAERRLSELEQAVAATAAKADRAPR
jgi:predicted component of type VI protein secretion system